MQKKYNKSSGWIATDWGGESGYRRCMTFYYSARKTSDTSRTVTVDWYMQFDGTDNTRLNTYYLAYYNQYLLIQEGAYDKNKSYKVSKSMGPTTDGYYNALTLAGSGLDNQKNGQAFFDTDGDYTGIERWVWIRGSKFWNGSFTDQLIVVPGFRPLTSATTSSLPFLPASSMPWLSTPRILVGLRFVTRMMFLPIICPGV